MEGEVVIDPLELSKHPKLIKEAQDEIKKLDVLVCGECHDVFHYIEPFQEHRQKGKCTGISVVRENYKHEPKAQVWAFMLWKNAQFKKAKDAERRGENMPTSWQIYQRWCKLSLDEKDAWISAGQTIQSFTKISAAKVQEIRADLKTEMKVRTQPATAIVKNKMVKSVKQDIGKKDDDDPLEEGEIRLSQLTNAQRVAIKAQVATNKANAEVDPLADVGDSEMDTEEEIEKVKKVSEASKKTAFKPVQLGNDIIANLKKSLDSRKATRTTKNQTTEEATIERILSRRFNHKKKCMEYFVKWENMNETENTWEPRSHLEKCKTVLEEFDKVFNKPKIDRKKRIEESHSEHSETEETTSGRPQRTSKQKALNQVKAWCGDITDGDEGSGKRKSLSDDDDDSSDSFEKKIKLEEDTDSSEDEKPSLTIRRIVKATNSVNGVMKKTSEAPHPATPQRVVRVSQKQLPSLSSGVYIMSKTEGIIKLDSNTPTTGNPLLRVGPKIGQTHIKVVKKDGSSPSNITRTPMKTVSKLVKTTDTKPSTSTPKPLTKVIPQQRTPATPTAKPPIKIIESNTGEKIVENVDLKSKVVDEDSDGLEELDFPTDIPLPEPESPPGEFTLCPLTGKILGENGQEDEENVAVTETTSLDHLVKEAVAEFSDVDMSTSTTEGKGGDDGKTTDTIASAPSISTPPPLASVSVTSIASASTPSVGSSNPSSVNTNITPAIVASMASVKAPPLIPISVTPTTTVSVTSVITPVGVNTSGQSSTPVKPVISEIKVVRTQDDIEENLKPITIAKDNPTESAKSIIKPKAVPTGTSILNAALTNTKALQSPSHMGPPKKLLSTTPHTVRQKVTQVSRSPISRPVVHRPSPTTTIIHKISPSRNRSVMPKTAAQQEPVLKRGSNVTTYKPANVARRIGNTTIYKTSEKPSRPPVKKSAPTSVVSTITTIPQPSLIQTTPTVINMPLLTTEEESAASNNVAPVNEIESLPTLSTDTELADLATFSLPDSETPILITGDDGTIYQVAGQNEDGQTILISEGPDGQQQCVLVASDPTSEETQTLMMDTTAAEPEELEQALMINTQPEETEGEGGDAEESQVVAQIIKADPPSPGGTRKVVLMLPDGNLMMTDVSAEQYAALDLDK